MRISVADQGPGIPEEFQQRLFDQFSQADRSKAKPGGSGLGLSIARGMVEGMHGRLRFDTGPDGTTFHVIFDRVPAREDDGPAARSRAASSKAASSREWR